MTTATIRERITVDRVSYHTKTRSTEPFDLIYEKYTDVLGIGTKNVFRSPTISSNGHSPTNWKALTQESEVSLASEERDHIGFTYYDETFRSYLPADDLIVTGAGPYASGFNLRYSGNTVNRLQVECLAKLGEGKVSMSVAAGEAFKSAETVAKLSGEALSLLRAIVRRDIEGLKKWYKGIKAADVPKNLSQRWLELQYGVIPLLRDVHEAGQVHNNGLGSSNVDATIQATRRLSERVKAEEGQGTYVHTVQEAHWKYQCKIRARVTDSSMQALKLLGLTDPLQVAWELVPWSFAIDWFIPIGTMLQALNAPVGLTFDLGSVSIKGENSGTCYSDLQGVCGTGGCSDYSPVAFSSSAFERIALGAFPSPMSYVKNPFSTGHAVNALALFVSLRR